MNNKRYYKLIKCFGHNLIPTVEIWHCSPNTILTFTGFVIPLDRKPRTNDYVREGA